MDLGVGAQADVAGDLGQVIPLVRVQLLHLLDALLQRLGGIDGVGLDLDGLAHLVRAYLLGPLDLYLPDDRLLGHDVFEFERPVLHLGLRLHVGEVPELEDGADVGIHLHRIEDVARLDPHRLHDGRGLDAVVAAYPDRGYLVACRLLVGGLCGGLVCRALARRSGVRCGLSGSGLFGQGVGRPEKLNDKQS